jgi:hypothetical protein
VDLVCSVGIPNDQLAVLRRGYQMSPVGRPMHGVDFGEMAFEGAFRFHAQPRQLLGSLARDISHCEANG